MMWFTKISRIAGMLLGASIVIMMVWLVAEIGFSREYPLAMVFTPLFFAFGISLLIPLHRVRSTRASRWAFVCLAAFFSYRTVVTPGELSDDFPKNELTLAYVFFVAAIVITVCNAYLVIRKDRRETGEILEPIKPIPVVETLEFSPEDPAAQIDPKTMLSRSETEDFNRWLENTPEVLGRPQIDQIAIFRDVQNTEESGGEAI